MGKRIEKVNRFAAERTTTVAASPVKAEEEAKKAPAKKLTAKKEVKAPEKKENTVKGAPKASEQIKTSVEEPMSTKPEQNRPSESIIEQLEKMSLANSSRRTTSNMCLSLDSNVIDGIKKAKDMYNIPLSRLVNTILKDFLDKNNIEY